MTTLIVDVEDDRAESLKKILHEIPYVKNVKTDEIKAFKEPDSTYEKILKIQQEIGGRDLFANIKDPVEWQREIRKEWDRDF